MTQAMQQGFGGIKEIKVAGTEDSGMKKGGRLIAFFLSEDIRHFFAAFPSEMRESLSIAGLKRYP